MNERLIMASKDNKSKKNYDDDSKSYSFKIIVIALLIIIILLLLLQSCSNFSVTVKGEYTGNYDIYEITLKGTCECPICETCNTCSSDSSSNNSSNTNISKPNSGTDEPEISTSTDYEPIDETGFIVYDKEDKWTEPTEATYQASIFRHSSYEVVDGVIAPGTKNVYKFIVRNLNDFDVNYTIKAIETNTSNINMKYRLRSETSYIIGSDNHWVDGSDLVTSLKTLTSHGRDTYYLDWKWFDDDINDTPIGIDDSSKYSIYIKVEAEEK